MKTGLFRSRCFVAHGSWQRTGTVQHHVGVVELQGQAQILQHLVLHVSAAQSLGK